MPKPFSEEERNIIYNRLLQAGRECWERYGIKKTTVQNLCAKADISKGSFYSFFSSKEILFMEILEQSHQEIKEKLMEVLKKNKVTQNAVL